MPVTAEIFKRYLTRTLIETGSYEGDGIQAGLDAGFEEIYSLDLSETAVATSRNRFVGNSKVKVACYDSAKGIRGILLGFPAYQIGYIGGKDNQCTFWLDAHVSQAPLSVKADQAPMTAIMGELEAISKHDIKNHIILIDDVRCFGTKDFDFLTEQEVKDRILQINPKYQFSYEDGYHWRTGEHFPKDILVARAV